jgi:hypothetical protein
VKISLKRILVAVCFSLLICGSVLWLLASILGSKGLVNVTVDSNLFEAARTCFEYAFGVAGVTIIIAPFIQKKTDKGNYSPSSIPQHHAARLRAFRRIQGFSATTLPARQM